MSRFDPRGRVNRALLVGVSEYDLTEPPHGVPGDLPAVKHNLNRLREVIQRGRVFGEHEITLSRSPSLDDFSRALGTAAAEAEGVLLLYFAGHGAVPSAGDELFLQMRNARVIAGGHAVFPGAERFTDVLTVLGTSRARRIVIVLDCCNAGNAAWIWEQSRERRRVLLLMSVQANHRIDAGDPRTPTPFTGELVQLLDKDGELWFRDLADEMRERMAAGGYRTFRGEPWEPQWRTAHDEDVLLSARGVRWPPAGGVPGPEPVSEQASGPVSEPTPVPVPSTPAPVPSTPLPAPPVGREEEVPGRSGAPGGGGESVPGPDPDPTPTPTPTQTPTPTPTQNRPPTPTPNPNPNTTSDPSPRPAVPPAVLPALLIGWGKALLAWLRRPRLPRLRRAGGRPGRVAAICAALLLTPAALGVGVYLYLLGHRDDGVSCAPPVELRVLTDPDLERTVRAAADTYLESEENTTGDGCRRSGITVYSAGTARAVNAFRKQSTAWKEPPGDADNPQRDVGPQPDVWIPATPADAARVMKGQDTDAVADLEPDTEPFAYSPIVLAVPQDLVAEPLHERAGPPLTRMIDDLRDRAGDAEVRRPDPEFTDTGLLATVGLYRPDTVDPARAERRIAPGAPSPTAADLLCTLPDENAVDLRTAALVPEFLMKSGVGCDSEKRVDRIAQYPGDVPGLEPLFVRVRWKGADRDRAGRDEAAAGFRTWLTGERGREVFARDGFRSATGGRYLMDSDDPGTAPDADTDDGVLGDPRPLDTSAGRDEMERALTSYQGANGPGRVLFLLDSSGSMTDRWKGPGGGPDLVRQALGGLGGRDEYGVWAVAGLGDRPYETLLPFGQHTRKDARAAIGERARVRDAEADPHAALLAALADMERRGTERPRLIVYVTDDEDAGRLTGAGLADVLAMARSVKVPVAMVSLVAGGCDRGRPDAEISAASGGRCVDAGEKLGAALHDEVARTGTGEE
ncbi:substrate-binding domain-containing protein [Streptomyces bullii]|uniref:Substrate-binding domain-containing protein n=1 Tax=Streptomyces bullii TaxID=349910 RepID=A0ABW0ULG3_9ACTN